MTMHPGKILRSWRLEADHTQRSAADMLYVDYTYISKIENGLQEPSATLIERMCKLYGCPHRVENAVALGYRKLPAWVEPAILSDPSLLRKIKPQRYDSRTQTR